MELKHAENPIDAAGPTKQVLSNLFYGWGYNFYRKENQLRADDLLIRSKTSGFLGDAREHLAKLESAWRRDHLPPPTRENPLPDAHALEVARKLQHVQQDIEALESSIRNASVPEMDRIMQRHRNERDTLEQLAGLDMKLVSTVKHASESIQGMDEAEIAADAAGSALRGAGIGELLKQRQAILSGLTD